MMCPRRPRCGPKPRSPRAVRPCSAMLSPPGPEPMPTKIKISAQFATSLHSPKHIAIAEQLGYDRAWLFDTPHESPDVGMMLALAAERTDRIGLGPGWLVAARRH